MNALPPDRRAAARARLARLPVGGQRAVEVAALAVDVRRTGCRSACRPRRAPRPSPRGRPRAPGRTSGRVSVLGRPGVVQPGPPQRLVGVDVADAGDQGLVEQRALEPGAPCAAARPRTRSSSNAGRAGRGRCARPTPARVVVGRAAHRHERLERPGRRRCAGRRSAAPGRRRRSDSRPAGAARPGASGGSDQQLAAHAEVGDQRLVRVAGSPSRSSHRYLPRRRAATSAVRPASRARRSAAPGRCRRTARGWRTTAPARSCGRRPGAPDRGGPPRPRAARARREP